jgi:hypothetical protein
MLGYLSVFNPDEAERIAAAVPDDSDDEDDESDV